MTIKIANVWNTRTAQQLTQVLNYLMERVGFSGELAPAPMLTQEGAYFTGDAATGNAWANIAFRAEITAYDSGTGLYAWKSQTPTAPNQAGWIDYGGARTGTVSVHPAYEANGNLVKIGTVVSLRRSYFDATYDWVYVFDTLASGGTVVGPQTIDQTTTTYNAPTDIFIQIMRGTVPASETTGFGKSVVQKFTGKDGTLLTVSKQSTTFIDATTASYTVKQEFKLTDFTTTWTWLTVTAEGTTSTVVFDPKTFTVGSSILTTITLVPSTLLTVGNNITTTVTINSTTLTTVGNNQTVTVTVNPTTNLKLGNGQTTTITLQPAGNIVIGGGTSATPVRFLEPSGAGTNFVAIRAPATLAGDTTYDLPNAYPAVTGYVLSSTTAGVTSWVANGGTTTPTVDTATIAADTNNQAVTAAASSVLNITASATNKVIWGLDNGNVPGQVATVRNVGSNAFSMAQNNGGGGASTYPILNTTGASIVVPAATSVSYLFDGTNWVQQAASNAYNPMVAVGDLIVGGTGGSVTKLTKGTPDQFVGVNALNQLVYQDPLTQGSSILYQTKGGTFSDGAQTTVPGTTSGQAIFSQSAQGNTYKKCVIYCDTLVGTAAYTFPTAFVKTPVILTTSGLASAVITSLSTTALTVTGATTTGFLFVEGY